MFTAPHDGNAPLPIGYETLTGSTDGIVAMQSAALQAIRRHANAGTIEKPQLLTPHDAGLAVTRLAGRVRLLTQDLVRGLSPLHFFIIGCANNVDVIFQRLDLPNKRAVS
jgi:hypothetical protein